MDRSRADEVLREWSTVANSAHRPVSAPRRHVSRAALPVGILAAAAVIVAAVFVFGIGQRHNAPVGMSPSPTATATETATPTANPTPTPTPGPLGSMSPNVQTAKVLTSASCQSWDYQAVPISKDGVIYAACLGEPGVNGEALVAFDAATGKKLAVYSGFPDVNPLGGFVMTGAPLVIDNGIWYSLSLSAFCASPDGCPPPAKLYRMDPQTKKVTFSLDGYRVAGDGLGYVWGVSANSVIKIDPKTLKTTTFAWPGGDFHLVGNELWSVKENNADTNEVITFTRVDPANGAVLGTFTEPGRVYFLAGNLTTMQSTADGTWVVNGYFAKLGNSGIEARSPILEPGNGRYGSLLLINGTFWLSVNNDSGDVSMQRLDPNTWQPVGPQYKVGGYQGIFTVGNEVWFLDQQNDRLIRMDLSLQ